MMGKPCISLRSIWARVMQRDEVVEEQVLPNRDFSKYPFRSVDELLAEQATYSGCKVSLEDFEAEIERAKLAGGVVLCRYKPQNGCERAYVFNRENIYINLASDVFVHRPSCISYQYNLDRFAWIKFIPIVGEGERGGWTESQVNELKRMVKR